MIPPSSKTSTPPRSFYNPIPTLIPSLSSSAIGLTSPITRIRTCSSGYAVAISDSTTTTNKGGSRGGGRGGGKLWSWGINSPFGRLGLGTISRKEAKDSSMRGMRF